MLVDLSTDSYLPKIGTLPGDAGDEEALGTRSRLGTGAAGSQAKRSPR
jgi:hypothetical protein